MIGDLKCCLIGLSGNSALCATRVGCAMSAPWLLPAAIGVRKWEGSGAPRSMKMGTILSPCPYDAAADRASQLAKLRHPTTLQYASRPRCLLEFAWCSGYPSIACSLDPPDRRDVPCVDGSELARVFFTFAGWSVQPCVRPVSAAHRPLAIAAGWPLCTENQIRKTASIKAIWIKSSPVERLHSERGGRRARNAIMQRLLAAVLAVACVVGST